MLIISDGGDNHSRYTEGEIKSMVKEADVLIYAIGIYDHYFPTEEEKLGPALLSDVTELTGGRAFTIDNPNDLADVATKIGIELRNQYVLGYRPTNPTQDGKWRKIKVKLTSAKGLATAPGLCQDGILCTCGVAGFSWPLCSLIFPLANAASQSAEPAGDAFPSGIAQPASAPPARQDPAKPDPPARSPRIRKNRRRRLQLHRHSSLRPRRRRKKADSGFTPRWRRWCCTRP